jgi:predicted alpha/beta-fold hydrolase
MIFLKKPSVLLILSSLTFAVFSTGAAQVGWAQEMANPPVGRPLSTGDEIHGVVSTIIPQFKPLAPDEIKGEKVYVLGDGTKLPTLFYPGTAPGPRPLIIANFGLFTDKASGAIGRFIRNLVLTGKIGADFLLVSNVTSATFYSENHEFGLGGYDEGKLLVELTEQIRGDHFENSSIELMGVSLGGNAVLQALIEDARLGRDDFQSAIVFSAVLNEGESSASLLSAFGHPIAAPYGPPLTEGGSLLAKVLVLGLKKTLKAEGQPYGFSIGQSGSVFYDNFKERLSRLHALSCVDESWNPQVSMDSVEDYLTTSSALVDAEIDQVKVPLIVVHAKNDPLVPFIQFADFAKREEANPRISTLAVDQGGHFGFASAYGDSWLNDLITRARETK